MSKGKTDVSIVSASYKGELLPLCGYCARCKWWGRGPKNGDCLDRDQQDWRACDVPSAKFRNWDDQEGGTFTAPDFGCVQFEMKSALHGG